MPILPATIEADDDYGFELKWVSFDRVDAIVSGDGDARMQFLVDGDWLPDEGLPMRNGFFTSKPGLTLIYPPGPQGVRFKRDVAGVGSTVDVELHAIG